MNDIKDEIVLVSKHYVTQASRDCGIEAVPDIDLGTRWGRVASFIF
jgi:hypothetical protein